MCVPVHCPQPDGIGCGPALRGEFNWQDEYGFALVSGQPERGAATLLVLWPHTPAFTIASASIGTVWVFRPAMFIRLSPTR